MREEEEEEEEGLHDLDVERTAGCRYVTPPPSAQRHSERG